MELTASQSKYFLRVKRKSFFWPDFISSSVAEIDISELKRLEISCLILDIDDTLLEHRGEKVNPLIASHLARIRAQGIELIIGSNTWRDISKIAESIVACEVDRKWWHHKPLPHFYSRLLSSKDLPPEKIVMVGDHIINDIMGANRLGITTILVEPFDRKINWLSRWYRERAMKMIEK